MRLSWLVLLFVLIAVGSTDDDDGTGGGESGPDEDKLTTSTAATESTTPSGNDGTTTTGTGGGDTDGPKDPTDEPTKEDTEDPSVTGQSPKTTPKAADTTTAVKTTKAPQTTTTKEPEPDVENFSVKCDKTTAVCTYTMQIPGLDIDTFNDLMKETNETGIEVQEFEDNDLVDLEAGVDKVFDDAKVTADYVEAQLTAITAEINDLKAQSVSLENAVDDLNTAVISANSSLNKILNKKNSCLYRMCILREQTTPKTTTTTTTKPPPTPYCDKPENKDKLCKANGGTCVTWYDSYYCTCTGNLDGQDNDCTTSVCDVIKAPQFPGPVFSPGYNGTNNAEDDCDSAQWTVKTTNSTYPYLAVKETDPTFKNGNYISNLSADSNLQISVGKYKLKITYKTKLAQINQILGYGNQAVISYSGPAQDFFHFTIDQTTVDPNAGL